MLDLLKTNEVSLRCTTSSYSGWGGKNSHHLFLPRDDLGIMFRKGTIFTI